MKNSLSNWKTRTILLGTLVGALTGATAAYILIQQAEKKNTQPKLNAGEGVKIGLGVLGLLRLVSDMANVK
jgi:hypothetical protein